MSEPFHCGICAIVSGHLNPRVRFSGGRLVPRYNGRWKENDVWAEFPCTLKEPHPKIGRHVHHGEHFIFSFIVPPDGVWMAGSDVAHSRETESHP